MTNSVSSETCLDSMLLLTNSVKMLLVSVGRARDLDILSTSLYLLSILRPMDDLT